VKTYVGLAIADGMFAKNCRINRCELKVEEVRGLAAQAESICNPTHATSLTALKARYGIEIAVPAQAPKVALGVGDSVIVMSVRGLPRETREFTPEEIAKATFEFGIWTVTE